MSLLSKIFGRGDALSQDAHRVYTALLKQSRNPAFYQHAGFEDNYDGRVDVLTLHMAALIHTVRRFDEQGERLSQAVFDVMKDDFEIALREEALSDGGVKNRIKPIIAHFFTRVKLYTTVLMDDTAPIADLSDMARVYLLGLRDEFDTKSLGEIALMDVRFPKLTENSS